MRRINLRVRPNAARNRIVSIINEIYNVDIKAPAKDSKANIEVVKFFTRHFKKKVKIVSGKSSKNKVLKIE